MTIQISKTDAQSPTSAHSGLTRWRRLVAVLTTASLLLASAMPAAAQNIMPRAPEIAGSSYILLDAKTGHVIMEHNADEALP
ncbi:MAG TPA: hypothetical protein DEG76_08060, partial [Pseudohongiella sp.]|nr:hypothetical protein [Pseudohongiella sp.]